MTLQSYFTYNLMQEKYFQIHEIRENLESRQAAYKFFFLFIFLFFLVLHNYCVKLTMNSIFSLRLKHWCRSWGRAIWSRRHRWESSRSGMVGRADYRTWISCNRGADCQAPVLPPLAPPYFRRCRHSRRMPCSPRTLPSRDRCTPSST